MNENNLTISNEDNVEVKKEYSIPNSVTVLNGPLNGKVYVIGTAHFSVKSQEEVAEVSRRQSTNRTQILLHSTLVVI